MLNRVLWIPVYTQGTGGTVLDTNPTASAIQDLGNPCAVVSDGSLYGTPFQAFLTFSLSFLAMRIQTGILIQLCQSKAGQHIVAQR